MTQEPLSSKKIVKVGWWGGRPFLLLGFYGYVYFDQESLFFKYFLLGLPWGIKKPRIVGIFPRTVKIPRNNIVSIGRMTSDWAVEVRYTMTGINKSIQFTFWTFPYSWFFGVSSDFRSKWIAAVTPKRRVT